MPKFTAHCACGKVSLEASGDPIFTGICHCKTCQRTSGSAFGAVVAVPEASVKVSGTLKTYDGVGDSGKATHRGFCPDCGATMTDSADIMPGVIMVPLGVLDDPSWVKPTVQIYCDSAQPWVQLGGEMKQFAKMPS